MQLLVAIEASALLDSAVWLMPSSWWQVNERGASLIDGLLF